MRQSGGMTNGTPTESELLRGIAALAPFVHAWNLPLNPEELHEMAWAILIHARSDGPLAEIEDEVGKQLAEYDESSERLRQAMAEKPNEQRRVRESDGRDIGEST